MEWCGEKGVGYLLAPPAVLPPPVFPGNQNGHHSTYKLRGGPSNTSTAQSESFMWCNTNCRIIYMLGQGIMSLGNLDLRRCI